MNIRILDEAILELEEAIKFYEKKVFGLGLDLEFEVRQAFHTIIQNPKLFPEDQLKIRKLIINRFPFIIHYSIQGTTIRIWAIAHSKRKPGYWKKRT